MLNERFYLRGLKLQHRVWLFAFCAGEMTLEKFCCLGIALCRENDSAVETEIALAATIDKLHSVWDAKAPWSWDTEEMAETKLVEGTKYIVRLGECRGATVGVNLVVSYKDSNRKTHHVRLLDPCKGVFTSTVQDVIAKL